MGRDACWPRAAVTSGSSCELMHAERFCSCWVIATAEPWAAGRAQNRGGGGGGGGGIEEI